MIEETRLFDRASCGTAAGYMLFFYMIPDGR